MGIGSSTTMRDQQQGTTKFTTSDTTDTPLKITRQYKDYGSTSFTGGNRNFDARSLGAPGPPGQRLELSPAIRARIEANRRSRGAAAAGAGRMLRAGGRGGLSRAPGRGDGRMRRRRENMDRDDNDGEDLAEIDAKVEAHMAPPPREWVDHTPEDLSLEDLRVDWPTVPTGEVGMVTGVEEKLRWMARRMQHGYDTPQELAQRLRHGKLVHFESEEEKNEVLKVAGALTAERVKQREDKDITPTDARFVSVRKEDRARLSDDLIKGSYPPIEGVKGGRQGKQTHAFLDEVVRILGNNETYNARDRGQLYYTIQKLLSGKQPVGA
jgi:hypothetical protein